MNNIEVKILNPDSINTIEKTMVCAARLTQRGHQIKNMQDFVELYNKPYSDNTVNIMAHLPHPTIQKFGVINIAIVGASRRFLAQITRHQNEVKFMSASLQYSDYSGEADFVVPYNCINDKEVTNKYLQSCRDSMNMYTELIRDGISNDEAGYAAPQGLRNILLISATAYQWKHMISQRICRRNTIETRYVMLKIWELLYNINPSLFATNLCGPSCCKGHCQEGKFSCGSPYVGHITPTSILKAEFPKLYKGDNNESTGI